MCCVLTRVTCPWTCQWLETTSWKGSPPSFSPSCQCMHGSKKLSMVPYISPFSSFFTINLYLKIPEKNGSRSRKRSLHQRQMLQVLMGAEKKFTGVEFHQDASEGHDSCPLSANLSVIRKQVELFGVKKIIGDPRTGNLCNCRLDTSAYSRQMLQDVQVVF